MPLDQRPEMDSLGCLGSQDWMGSMDSQGPLDQPAAEGSLDSLDCWERLDWMVEEVQTLEQGSLGCLDSQDWMG